ncbi:MAG: hypothetical protein A3I72_05260 [Candidatus Tectomicrobia bacterium RIFCSPLOWO2_02_FULL_70_19]|nr:MAG: hypothetical protein A3I72_05260 [Candidatus Tectomicrobia bacterium RIFCSPLOWO2_02_FULL_70_19]
MGEDLPLLDEPAPENLLLEELPGLDAGLPRRGRLDEPQHRVRLPGREGRRVGQRLQQQLGPGEARGEGLALPLRLALGPLEEPDGVAEGDLAGGQVARRVPDAGEYFAELLGAQVGGGEVLDALAPAQHGLHHEAAPRREGAGDPHHHPPQPVHRADARHGVAGAGRGGRGGRLGGLLLLLHPDPPAAEPVEGLAQARARLFVRRLHEPGEGPGRLLRLEGGEGVDQKHRRGHAPLRHGARQGEQGGRPAPLPGNAPQGQLPETGREVPDEAAHLARALGVQLPGQPLRRPLRPIERPGIELGGKLRLRLQRPDGLPEGGQVPGRPAQGAGVDEEGGDGVRVGQLAQRGEGGDAPLGGGGRQVLGHALDARGAELPDLVQEGGRGERPGGRGHGEGGLQPRRHPPGALDVLGRGGPLLGLFLVPGRLGHGFLLQFRWYFQSGSIIGGGGKAVKTREKNRAPPGFSPLPGRARIRPGGIRPAARRSA